MEQQIERQPANIIWVSSINNGVYVKQEGEFAPNYVDINGKKVSRINLIATVIQKTETEENRFSSITLDDGSAQIRAKVWGEDTRIMKEINVSDIVLVIGKLREYQQEMYIVPEVVKKISPKWLVLRNLELVKEYGKPEKMVIKMMPEKTANDEQKIEVHEEKMTGSNEQTRQKIINKIEELDKGDGAEISEVLSKSGMREEDAEKILQSLVLEGEVFNISPTKIKLT